MTPVRTETSHPLQDSRPKTDYERWLEEKDEHYQIAEDSEYHPPIPGIHGQIRIFHHVLDNSPPETVHSTKPDATHLQTHRFHGEFLHRGNAHSPSPLKSAMTDILHEPCVWQLVLLFVVIVAFLHAGLSLQKGRTSGRTSSSSASTEPIAPALDEKDLV
ncbi:hypothetical protein BDV33DRAFT_4581 [Aspergillus novoparasiticus]|uniref:Uncharacterized protein n=1 Tax=Aspergillus novoparasiticus TaxID=986946 RepID=A0A5N6F519_9EURO|nr:hypothetical protein BDV33DRAFT_4581 [Aspergillus novoparasiticus]